MFHVRASAHHADTPGDSPAAGGQAVKAASAGDDASTPSAVAPSAAAPSAAAGSHNSDHRATAAEEPGALDDPGNAPAFQSAAPEVAGGKDRSAPEDAPVAESPGDGEGPTRSQNPGERGSAPAAENAAEGAGDGACGLGVLHLAHPAALDAASELGTPGVDALGSAAVAARTNSPSPSPVRTEHGMQLLASGQRTDYPSNPRARPS